MLLNLPNRAIRLCLPAFVGACLLASLSVPQAVGQTKNTNTSTSPNPATSQVTPCPPDPRPLRNSSAAR